MRVGDQVEEHLPQAQFVTADPDLFINIEQQLHLDLLGLAQQAALQVKLLHQVTQAELLHLQRQLTDLALGQGQQAFDDPFHAIDLLHVGAQHVAELFRESWPSAG